MTRRKIQRKTKGSIGGQAGPEKDQLLCELEIQRTQSERQIQELREANEQLQNSRNYFAQLYDSAPTGKVIFDQKAQIQWLNLTAARFAGIPREQMVGSPFALFVAKPHLAKFFDHLRRCRLFPAEKVETELEFAGPGKEAIPMQILSARFTDSGRILYQTTLIDLRARKAVERSSQEAQAYSEQIIQTVNQPLLVLDKDLVVTLANPAFYRIFKLRPKEVIGAMFHCVDESTASAAKLRDSLLQVTQQQKWFEDFEFESKSPNGRRQFLLLNAQPLFHKTHLGPLILLSLHDITERHEADEVREHLVAELGKLAHELEDRVSARTLELQQANAKLQILSARLLEAQEMERRHLARELHDEIGQQITCLQILTEQQFALAPPPLQRALKETRSATGELLQTVRQLSSDLRPQLLDDFGALAALEWHFKKFRKRTGIQVRLNKRNYQEELLNSFLRNVLFRVAQESLTNVARHAHTNKVTVELSTRQGVCRLLVRDNGQGFDVNEALRKGSFGLTAMQERVFLAGGNLKCDSAPGKGTTIEIELPLISPHTDVFDPDYIFKDAGS